jgi:hypothetical protein
VSKNDRLVGQMDMWNAATDSRAYDFDVEKGESIAGAGDPMRWVAEAA